MIEISVCNLPDNLNENLLNSILSQLPNNLLKKIKKKQVLKDQFRSAIGYLLVQNYFLNKGMEKEEILFIQNIFGKPEIINKMNISFNISHSENIVACAFSNSVVGIDIEYLKHINIEEIYPLFSKKEQNILNNLSSSTEKLFEFYRLWTSKESFYKCKGESLDLSYKHCEINVFRDRMLILDKALGKIFYSKSLLLKENYLVTFCSPDLINLQKFCLNTIKFRSLMR